MNSSIQGLIVQANKIVQCYDKKPGTRYPEELKGIVSKLALEHRLSVKQIIQSIPISAHSAREWPKQNVPSFKKIEIKQNQHHEKPQKKTFLKNPLWILVFVQVLELVSYLLLH